jgi:hypothetical protein
MILWIVPYLNLTSPLNCPECNTTYDNQIRKCEKFVGNLKFLIHYAWVDYLQRISFDKIEGTKKKN